MKVRVITRFGAPIEVELKDGATAGDLAKATALAKSAPEMARWSVRLQGVDQPHDTPVQADRVYTMSEDLKAA